MQICNSKPLVVFLSDKATYLSQRVWVVWPGQYQSLDDLCSKKLGQKAQSELDQDQTMLFGQPIKTRSVKQNGCAITKANDRSLLVWELKPPLDAILENGREVGAQPVGAQIETEGQLFTSLHDK